MELWRMVRPWTPKEWAHIERLAREVREYRHEARMSLPADRSLPQYMARSREAQLRTMSVYRVGDLA